MPKLIAVAAFTFVLAAASQASAARDYYVSPSGNDTNSGATAIQAWLTINRLNLVTFVPGDRILLEGGQTLPGNLFLDSADFGTPAAPIVVTSYGTGRATIDGGTGTAIQIYNTSGISITNLSVAGAGASLNTGSGISVYTDLPGDVKLPFININGVNATGFGLSGIEVGGNSGASGFKDVTIAFAAAWSNGRHGIATYGAAVAATHENVYVGYSKAFNNRGINHVDSTGNGIVIAGVDGGVIERSVAHDNGAGSIGPHGPVGIWAYYSNNVTIQYNESYNNRAGGWADGGGFALDVGVTNSTLQYNYSHGNDGSGLLLAGGPDPADHANNIVRYNVSQNDSRRNGYGAIEIWGKTRNTHIFNNTVFTSADPALEGRVVYITNGYADGQYATDVSFRNNIFYATGGIPNLEITPSALSGASVRFEGNNYYATTGSPKILWGGVAHASVSGWAASTGQETAGGSVLGTSADPRLVGPGGGWTFDDASRLKDLTAYALRGASPLIDAGVNLGSVGLPAVHDFYDMPVPQGGGFDVGANEWTAWSEPPIPEEVVLYATDVASRQGWTVATDTTAAAGTKLTTADQGVGNTAAPLAAPAQYFDVPFAAVPNTRYRLWLRLRAKAESKYNDSVYVQFSDALNSSGAPVYRLGTTSGLAVNLATCSACVPTGWGWQNGAYWLADTGEVWFATAGPHTLRVQIREDGVELDQIVLSPSQYLDRAPGPVTNDTTIVPKPSGTPPPPPPNSAPSVALTAPAPGATIVAPGPITVAASAADSDGSIVRVEFYAGATALGTDTTAPFSVTWTNVAAGSYTLTAIAVDNAAATTTSAPVNVTVTAAPPPGPGPAEVVLYATDIAPQHGWSAISDGTAAGGIKLATTDQGIANTTAPLAAPAQYFDVSFAAAAGTRYRIWLRLRAKAESKYNDSIYVQFSDAVTAGGAPAYRIGTTAGLAVNLATCSACVPTGWGWQNGAYWLADNGEVRFATAGPHTLRVQIREDGVELDQIVLSPAQYLNQAPGPFVNDTTIVPKP